MVLEGFTEEARRARIEQNRLQLIALGLTNEACVAHLQLQPRNCDSKRTKRPHQSSEETRSIPTRSRTRSTPTRSSKRLQGISAPEPTREHSQASSPQRLVLKAKREVSSLSSDGQVQKDFTSHNIMRLKSMPIGAQEKRISKISNLVKLNNLIQIYREEGETHLHQLAIQRKQQLIDGT